MNSLPLACNEIEALRRMDACSVANAIETFNTRLPNEGFADRSIRCLLPKLPSMVGYAVTLKIRGANPPTGRRSYLDRTDWWDYVKTVPEPRILVVQDESSKPGIAALLGEVHISILMALGCVGAVTNGSVRDFPAIEKLGFHVFAGGLSVSHAYVHIVEVGLPVTVGGLVVQSSDLIHGDLHGIQTIPVGIASRLPDAAAHLATLDQAIIALCRSSDFTLSKLRTAVSSRQS
ncbi:MAG TPA: RraA family protein [Opitutaceae bacterium]|jgi:regulator of RNase E activity RraA